MNCIKQQNERREVDSTCRAEIPSFSGVLTWETILSSTQRTVMGTLAPHLSQRADIPHLTAIRPVRFDLGVMTPGLGSMRRGWGWMISVPSSKASLLNRREKKNWNSAGVVAVVVVVVVVVVVERSRRREMRPLDKADIARARERPEWGSVKVFFWRET